MAREGEARMGAITVRNQQDRKALAEDLLGQLAEGGAEALRLIGARYLQRVNPPEAVSVVLIDDAEIGRVHGEFLDDPSPTDVITFPYGAEGEILISVETAARQALDYRGSLAEELALYLVHGLLHLCGYEDTTESGRKEMAEVQESLVREAFGAP